MFCGHCGKELKENDKFCPNCGHQNPLYKEELVIGEEKKEETNEVSVKEATLTTTVEDKKIDKNEDKGQDS